MMSAQATPLGCYFRQERNWTTIEWRFFERHGADLFAAHIGAEPAIPIADLPHNTNGWSVRTREPLGERLAA